MSVNTYDPVESAQLARVFLNDDAKQGNQLCRWLRMGCNCCTYFRRCSAARILLRGQVKVSSVLYAQVV